MKKKYKRKYVNVGGHSKVLARLVVAKHLGRPLLTSEIVHHIDGNAMNNDIANLQVVSRAEHKRIHSDIGIQTRFRRVHCLNDSEILTLFKTKTCTEIAAAKGCHYKTISRLVRRVLGKTFDLRTRRSGSHNNYNKADLYE